MPGVNAVVLVPVKAFADAKARLASVLDDADRQRLARWTSARVLAAAGELPTFVACDDEEVASWAGEHGATVLWHPGVGLNAADAQPGLLSGNSARENRDAGNAGATH